MNKDQVYELNDVLAAFMDSQGMAVDDAVLDDAVWAVVRVFERAED